MKLKRSEMQWCWANFKYEGLPTFYFICEIIGHSDKFCDRLFDTSIEEIEKSYGAWMRADPRRRNLLTGSKWLRQSGSFPVSGAAVGNNQGGDNADSMIVVKEK